jgi:hypothetical protein
MDAAPSVRPGIIGPKVAQTPTLVMGASYSASSNACQPQRAAHITPSQNLSHSKHARVKSVALVLDASSIKDICMDDAPLAKPIAIKPEVAQSSTPVIGIGAGYSASPTACRPRRQAGNSRSSADSQLKQAIQIRNFSLSSAPQRETVASQWVKPGQQKQTIQIPGLGFLPPSRAPVGYSSRLRASQLKQAMPASGGQPFSMPVAGAGYSKSTKACLPRRP